MNKLLMIQSKLNVPKDLKNTFGGYMYRSCESILTALKPLLKEQGLTLILTDDIVLIGTRTYVKATAKLYDSEKEIISVTAFAREDEIKKGMDLCQITGAASSYCRKYALNGMFLIDDTKDSDHLNENGKEAGKTGLEALGAQKKEKAAQYAKDNPNGVEIALGNIEKRNDPNKGGYVSYELENYLTADGRFNLRFTTNDKVKIETLDKKHAAGEKVSFEYMTKPYKTTSGKTGLNYEIVEVLAVLETEQSQDAPF